MGGKGWYVVVVFLHILVFSKVQSAESSDVFLFKNRIEVYSRIALKVY